LLRVVSDLTSVPFDLVPLDRAAAALADQIDEFLAQRPSLRERIDALREEELKDAASLSASEPLEQAPSEPAGELPSSEAVLRDLEEFLRGLRGEDSA
jgi:hypothetical protein